MVSLIFLVLSRFEILPFSWWIMFIEGIVVVAGAVSLFSHQEIAEIIGTYFGLGLLSFAFYKLFCGLVLSWPWVLLAGVVSGLALLIPGGLTFFNVLLSNAGMINLPQWVFIAGIVIDVIVLIIEAYAIFSKQ